MHTGISYLGYISGAFCYAPLLQIMTSSGGGGGGGVKIHHGTLQN